MRDHVSTKIPFRVGLFLPVLLKTQCIRRLMHAAFPLVCQQFYSLSRFTSPLRLVKQHGNMRVNISHDIGLTLPNDDDDRFVYY